MSFIIGTQPTNYVAIVEALSAPHDDWRNGTRHGDRPVQRLHLLQMLVLLKPQLVVNRELWVDDSVVLRLCCIPSQVDEAARTLEHDFPTLAVATKSYGQHGPYACAEYKTPWPLAAKDAAAYARLFTGGAPATEVVLL